MRRRERILRKFDKKLIKDMKKRIMKYISRKNDLRLEKLLRVTWNQICLIYLIYTETPNLFTLTVISSSVMCHEVSSK